MNINHFILSVIVVLIFSGCVENSKPEKNAEVIDSVRIIYNQVEDKKNDEETNNEFKEENDDMVDISTIFSAEEIDKIRLSYIKQLRYEFQSFVLAEDESMLPGEDWRLVKRVQPDVEISDKEKSENMDVLFHILLKKYPILKPVSQKLFEEKIKSVFDLDVNVKNMCDHEFYTNHEMINQTTYSTYIDFKNRIVTFDNLPLLFKKDFDLDEMNEKLENVSRESVEYCEKEEQFYEEYLSEALRKKYIPFCSKSDMERLFHINNYVFYDNKASLSWLLSDDLGKVKLAILFEFFNYDKEPRINKYMMDIFFKQVDVNKGYPLNTNQYESLFGEVRTCPQTDYYNHFKFKVRTGLMQYIVDNCYDEEDLDDCGLKKDKYICVMEDCFDYLFKFVLQGDKYKESENCHYYQVCAYLAYYLQKAYDSYLSHNDGEPRCWHNALANNLYQDLRNNDGRFEKYVKENNYFNLDGFDQIMADAHDQAMR